MFSEVKAERQELEKLVDQEGPFDVLITSYEQAQRASRSLRTISWTYVVVDEAHRIKNEKTNLAKIVRTFRSTNRLILTGTPIQNNLHELWALLNFLMPSVFDDAEDFDNMFQDITGEGPKTDTGGWIKADPSLVKDQSVINKHVETLQKIIKPFILRRIKAEVETSIPPKKEVYVFVGMSNMQRNLYKKFLTKDFLTMSSLGIKNSLRCMGINLRKVCGHPYLFTEQEQEPFEDGPHIWENSEKMRVLDLLLEKL